MDSLTNKLISDEVIIQHHKADHGKLGQVNLELKALIEDGIVSILDDSPGAALCAVSWDSMNLHVHIWVHHVTFGPRAFGFGQVLTTDHLEEESLSLFVDFYYTIVIKVEVFIGDFFFLYT